MKYLIKNGNREAFDKRITNVAEKYHVYGDELRAINEEEKSISWDIFTKKDMCAGWWETDYERKLWVEKRSNMWKDSINEKFIELGYAERLFVEHNTGVILRYGNVACWKMTIYGLEKQLSISNRRSKGIESFSQNLNGVGRKKGIAMAGVLGGEGLAKYLYGEIGADDTLTIKERNVLFEILETCILKKGRKESEEE